MFITIAMLATVLCGSLFFFFVGQTVMAERLGDRSRTAVYAILSVGLFIATTGAGITWDISSKKAHARGIRESAVRAVYAVLAVDAVGACNGLCERSAATLKHTETGRRIRILVPNTTVPGDLLIVACEDAQCEFVKEFKH